MKLGLKLALGALVLSWSCHDPTYPESPAGCSEACQRGVELGCEYSLPSPSGQPCETICVNAEENGRMWNTPCLMGASSCDEADACM